LIKKIIDLIKKDRTLNRETYSYRPPVETDA